MKSNEEKKSKVKSIKLSPKQEKIIIEKAQAKGMTFSEYVLDRALHSNDGVTPLVAVKVQEIVNMVMDIADSIDADNYVKGEELKKKAIDLDGLFTSASPQNKLNEMKQNTYKIIGGCDEIWESLK